MVDERCPLPVSAIRPLVVGTQPFPGESLSSVLLRACEANVFTKTSHLLSLIGLRAQASEAVPFTRIGAAPAIAKLIGTTRNEIESRMHPTEQDDLGRSMIHWFGTTIERRHIEASGRRFAPQSLELHAHSPAIWAVRLLDYCPVTMELLYSECPQCSGSLRWRACRSLLKCEKCGASLLRAASRTLPSEFHEGARLGAALVSPAATVRQTALSSLPDPFSTWAPADALVGLLTLGQAQLSLESREQFSNTAGAAAMITAGLEFVRNWPSSLPRFVKISTSRTNSTSVRTGLGPLGKLFLFSAKRTPIRDLIRSAISTSFEEAVVPAKIFSGATVNRECRRGMLSALQASKLLGIRLERLRNLEGQSEAFLARHNVHRGVALYDEAAVSRLREVLDQSVTPKDCARQLGIPNYCVEAFVSAGLLEGVADRDAEIVRGSGLIKKASIVDLRERCQKQEQRRSIEGGVALRETMRRYGAPQDWVAAFDDVVSGRIQHQFIGGDHTSLSDALFIDPTDIARHASHHFSGFEISKIDISCQAAAKIIGTSTQFISAAVKIGFLEGAVGIRNSAIPLERVLEFQENFILGEELRAVRGGGHQRSISCELRRAGLEPTATINRTTVWLRSDIEKYIEMQSETSRAGD